MAKMGVTSGRLLSGSFKVKPAPVISQNKAAGLSRIGARASNVRLPARPSARGGAGAPGMASGGAS